MKILGREPAWWSGVIQAVLLILMTWDPVQRELQLSDERIAAIMAVVNCLFAVYLAYVIRETMLAAGVEVAKAVLALLLAYNVEISANLMASILGLLAILGGGYLRTQAAPLARPKFGSSYNDQTLTAKLAA